jgi:DNA polymerase III delta subunit
VIYLLSGKEVYPLLQKRQHILKDSGVRQENITVFDASSPKFSLSSALAACGTISLFGDRRAVILEDPFFLNPGRKTGAEKPDGRRRKADPKKDRSSLLEAYCREPNPDCDLILFCDGFEADQRTREYKTLKPFIEKRRVQEYIVRPIKPREMPMELDRRLGQEGLELTPEARQELLLRIDGSLSELERTLDKLKLYGQKRYGLEDIEHLVSIQTDQMIWKMCNAMAFGSGEQMMRYYRQLLDLTRTPPNQMIAAMAKVLRRLYISLLCYEKGMPDDAISASYGILYPSLDRRTAGLRDSRYFFRCLKELADLDQGIKDGTIGEPQEAVELFLLRQL